MSIRKWMDSEPVRHFRTMMFDQQRNTVCRLCYHEEGSRESSRRHRSNQKSVIFTKNNFQDSYLQSPGWDKFEHSRVNDGAYDGSPIDLHIDLGNFCNLTCKMCKSEASSSIASQEVRWGIKSSEQYLGTDWTRDQETWSRVLNELADIKNLKNVHFMGGETLLTPRFENFIDFMLSRNRTDLNFSFVTNGTKFNSGLINKLKKFQRVGIEVSIETLTQHNEYQRQGTDNRQVLENIQQYLSLCNGDNITLTIRPAISLLTIGSYWTLLEFCLQKSLIIKSLLVTRPKFLDARILPDDIKKSYQTLYRQFLEKYDLFDLDLSKDFNESDPNQIRLIVKNQVMQVLNLLESPRPQNSDFLLRDMVRYCRRWDDVHGYDARHLYPEFRDILDEHGY